MEKKRAADSLFDARNGISEEFQREASCGRLRNHAEQSKEGRADVTGISDGLYDGGDRNPLGFCLKQVVRIKRANPDGIGFRRPIWMKSKKPCKKKRTGKGPIAKTRVCEAGRNNFSKMWT